MAILDESVDALVSAGVRLEPIVRAELNSGDFSGALIDAIAAADRQELALPADVLRSTRTAFESLRFRPGSTLRARVDETLQRVEQRAASNVATKTEDLIDALAAAGVRLDAAVHGQRELGDFQSALLDTIAIADEQQVALPTGLLHEVRVLFETGMYFRPESTMRSLVDETLKRVEQRAASNVATKTELVDALAAAGVRLDAAVREELDIGDFQFALLDAIALADEQQVSLPKDLLREVRAQFETKMYFRPESTMRSLVDETLKRVEQRAANGSFR